MTQAQMPVQLAPPLDLDGFHEWLVVRGLRGLTLAEQLEGFCERVAAAGFPMKRAGFGMGTLHPRIGAQTYVWHPGRVEHIPRDRSARQSAALQNSPVKLMRDAGIRRMRQRLDTNDLPDIEVFSELRDEGLLDYAAMIVAFEEEGALTGTIAPGVFFSCATDEPAGFDDGHLAQITKALFYLALAIKSRATFDVATAVLETYLGEDPGRRVLTGAIDRGSVETIRAVIWICDLRGFTRLSDTLPQGEIVALLDDYLDLMAGPVRENNGQILKFTGDGFLATFDLTGLDGEAVCRNALKAAAELRGALPAFNEARAKACKPVTEFGLALHLGDVLYGNIGAQERLDFTVIGPAVNEASRIQALCRPLERDILISSAFHEIARTCHGELVSLGPIALRGVRKPQEIFTLKP
ncbi:MAG: adenylate/guanylate cyclase domain-containing protein [Rhodospirillales bacterium]|nr:adenylate/guanylate cyclase domain-containing protein [Rhodospirillales bacterium]MDH3918079.1 adenylate/guanylate cyclase domain-containing protein [Rhodospirillales bacterium]